MRSDRTRMTVQVPGVKDRWELLPMERSPCTLACPTRINARGYVTLIADRRYDEALELIRERNPFPGVCGRICPSPCEAACRRGEYDDPIAVCALKRFVFDNEMKRGADSFRRFDITRREKVAVVGGGPAGLSAALDLARLGYPATVFEAREELGGMMNIIPGFRLPERVVRREVQAIVGAGIEIMTGMEFGTDFDGRSLARKGFKAVLLATGAWSPSRHRLKPGGGIVHALEIFGAVERDSSKHAEPNRHAASLLGGKRIVVAGDGMMALDAARTAVRAGCRSVTLVTAAGREHASFRRDDLSYALGEGVDIRFLSRMEKVTRRGRSVNGLVCSRLSEGAPDATGRRRVAKVKGSGATIPADIVVDASGRSIELGSLRKIYGLSTTPLGTVRVSGGTMEAAPGGIFAAGDMVSGPRSVVEAVASGQKAARGIHEYLSGEHAPSPFDREGDGASARREFSIDRVPSNVVRRVAIPARKAAARRKDFDEVEEGLPDEAACREAQRCLRCGPCAECEVCTDICEKKHMQLEINGDLVTTVTAGREFWEHHPEKVSVEIDTDRAEGRLVRRDARVNGELCIGCGRCEDTCNYKSVRVVAYPPNNFIASVNEITCKGCGNCVSVCPTCAMDQMNFERSRLFDVLEAVTDGIRKVLFICRWASPERLDLPEDVLVVELECTGRITTALIVDAAQRAAGGIMVCGCETDRCHYGTGRLLAGRAVIEARAVLALLGCDPHLVREGSCDPGGFKEVVGAWARRKRK